MNDRWLAAWVEGRTAFHLSEPNPHLVRWADRWLGGAPRRVFVPLCGRTVDVGWLAARGHEVVGAELSPLAARGLFEDVRLSPTITPGTPERWSADGVTLFVGDVFHLTPGSLAAAWSRPLPGPVHVWDRAALIALPPEVRGRYAAHVSALAGPGARILLSTMSYDQSRMEGPPFSVPDDEVAALYAGHAVEVWDSADEAPAPRFRERGLDRTRRSTALVTLTG
jgi:thiopurine S-methyltransferase